MHSNCDPQQINDLVLENPWREASYKHMQGKKWVWLTIRIGFSLILLGLLFWKADLSQFSEVFRNINLSLFLVSLLSYMLLFIPLSYRWQLLLQALGIKVPMERLFKTYLIGVFFNNFLPTTIGGDVVRGYDLYRFTQKGKEAVVSVIVERFLGFTAMMVIAVAALVFSYSSLQDPLLTWLIVGAALVYLVTLLVLFTPAIFILSFRILQKLEIQQLGPKLLKISEAVSLYKSSPRVLIQTVLLSLFLQAWMILNYYVLTHSLHLSVPLAYLFLFFPIINIVSMIPISLGGLGLREGITVYLFQKIGVESAHALGLSLAWFSLIFFTSLLGGAVFAFRDVSGLPPPASGSGESLSRMPKTKE